MYSFLFDQTYLNLLILVIIVTLVMFLWRKLIILEGNFFVLEKRVNLIKKDAREDSISRNIEKSDTIMNEIFKDFSPSNACKQSKCVGGMSVCVPQENTPYIVNDDEDMVQFVPEIITFANGGNLVVDSSGSEECEVIAEGDGEDRDIDRMVDTIISSSDEYEKNVREDAQNDTENDTMSVTSEITFGDDKKALTKKYSKLSLDKLKDICNQNKINNEGTKNQLITRIIEVNK
jgi:hypothetical protein